MEIRSVQGPQGLDALGATAAPPPQQQPEGETSKVLDPAVKVDLSSSAYQSRFIRDVDTSAIVFQVVDSSGDVVDQLPSENVLRNRAYASSSARSAENRDGAALRVA